MNFRRFDAALLPDLMAWFPDATTVRTWGGPEFRHPFTPASFREDARVDAIDSWSLVRADGALAAFGQCYLRIERCHFGRVAVAPEMRGAGLGTRLLREMAREGRAKFGDRELSLFVLRGNEAAHRLYRRLGFVEAEYPDPEAPAAGMRYMIAADLADG